MPYSHDPDFSDPPLIVRLRLIGQMEAMTLDNRSVLPPGRKTRALLAIVALSAPRPVLRSRLAELLWSRRLEEQARASLRQEIHRLLDVLTTKRVDIIVVARDHLLLRPGTVWTDADEVLRATSDNPLPLNLLDSELLEDLDGVDPAFDTWLEGERERLRDRARVIGESLLREAIDAGPDEVLAAGQRLLTIDRAHEGAWRAIMRAHAERGERGMAVQAFDRCRAVLSELMDSLPSPETQRLLNDIRSGQLVTTPAKPPPIDIASEPRQASIREGARIGVLPLQAVSGDDESGRIASGLTAEIASGLARFRSLYLVSTESIGQGDQPLRNSQDVTFVLNGSVQRVGERLRVSMQLRTLGENSHVVWGRHFDRRGHDLLTLQDEISSAIAAQVEPQILLEESRRSLSVSVDAAGAYELVMRAMPATVRLEHDEFLQAGELLRRAISEEPAFAAAHSWLATWQLLRVEQGWAEDRIEALQLATGHAERAIALDPQDARGFAIAGEIRAYLERRPQEALTLYERAIAFNPYFAPAYALAALAHLYIGQLNEADRLSSQYKQLSPDNPHAFIYDKTFSEAALLRHDYALAVTAGRAVSEMNPRFVSGCYAYLSALGHLREEQEAAKVRNRLMALQPNFTVQMFLAASPYQRTEDREVFASGLRRAGIPDGELASV